MNPVSRFRNIVQDLIKAEQSQPRASQKATGAPGNVAASPTRAERERWEAFQHGKENAVLPTCDEAIPPGKDPGGEVQGRPPGRGRDNDILTMLYPENGGEVQGSPPGDARGGEVQGSPPTCGRDGDILTMLHPENGGEAEGSPPRSEAPGSPGEGIISFMSSPEQYRDPT